MTDSSAPRCASCRFFLSSGKPDEGQCLRYPPVLDVVSLLARLGDGNVKTATFSEVPESAGYSSDLWAQPVVSAEWDWCGEHRGRDDGKKLDADDDGLIWSAASTGWWKSAGFDNMHEAHNALCFEHNAHEFRDGQRVEEAKGGK